MRESAAKRLNVITYSDAAAAADGITKALLKGSDQNKSKVQVRGKCAGLPGTGRIRPLRVSGWI
jgi:hypothetical protein